MENQNSIYFIVHPPFFFPLMVSDLYRYLIPVTEARTGSPTFLQ